MNCALWLNKQKVRHASEIPENLDVASLRGYFLAGSLLEWLRQNGGEEYAEKLSGISADDVQLNKKIADIFNGKPLRAKPMRTASDNSSEQPPVRTPGETEQNDICGSAVSSYFVPSSGSFKFANYGSGSSAFLQLSSFGEFWELLQKIGTGSFGSFNLGSYSQWAWLFALFERGYGSFAFGSFSSFHEWEWEWFFRLFTSKGGSFSMSSFGSFYADFFSGIFGSFDTFADPPRFPVLDEYDRIMLETLMICPLDRFGYGVHNI